MMKALKVGAASDEPSGQPAPVGMAPRRAPRTPTRIYKPRPPRTAGTGGSAKAYCHRRFDDDSPIYPRVGN